MAPGLGAITMVKGMNQRALGKILVDTFINRLFDPTEVASLISELYRNAAYRPWATLGPSGFTGTSRKV